jgi:hypothetical protein
LGRRLRRRSRRRSRRRRRKFLYNTRRDVTACLIRIRGNAGGGRVEERAGKGRGWTGRGVGGD